MRHQQRRLRLPVRNVNGQSLRHCLRFTPGFGGHHFNALGQQHRRFTLYLGLVLQVFDYAHALGNPQLQARQRLFAQRRSGFGSIALPGHGVGNIEFGQTQQTFGFGRPLGRHRLLQLGTLGVVQALAQQLSGTFVAAAEFAENVGQHIVFRVAKQPLPDTAGPFACGGSAERASGDFVQLG